MQLSKLFSVAAVLAGAYAAAIPHNPLVDADVDLDLDLGKAVDGVGGTVGRLLDGVVGTADKVVDGVVGTANNVVGGVGGTLDKVVDGVGSTVDEVAGTAHNVAGTLLGAANNLPIPRNEAAGINFIRGNKHHLSNADLDLELGDILDAEVDLNL